jgi:microsomal epoxide hydrolase
MSVQRFEIRIPDPVLEDLRGRLERTRFPDQLEGVGWSEGTELGYLRELCEYWHKTFDWRAQERMLNRFEQFTAEVDGLELHFAHVRSRHTQALPLLLVHGWPGSFWEFHKVIEPLAEPTEHGASERDAFHVICPSLPGYGFSEAPRRPGFDVKAMAQVLADLMHALGYDAYGVQGGDWGAIILSWLASLYPERLTGLHINMVVAPPPAGDESPLEGATPIETAALSELTRIRQEYIPLQQTNPQTLAYGLNDSPAGLAAWIVHKFRRWSDCQGDLERSFSKDELLTNVTLYWVTQTIGSSLRLYHETAASGRPVGYPEPIGVPTGCALFPAEPYRVPRRWAERQYNVQRWTELPRGGHFAALEAPDLLVEDLRAFFRELR